MNEDNKIKEIAKDLCEKSGCHHKCNDTKDCVVEDEALLLINQNKSNNFDVKSNEELFKQALVEGLNRRFDREIEEAKKIEQIEQIEGMSRDICPLNVPCEECTMLAKQMGQSKKQYCKPLQYAKRAYKKGWRKQSEGHWITPTVIGGRAFNVPHCSTCKGIPCGVDENTKYCPYCGAKNGRSI